jgi:hypothetical protein
LPYNNSTEEGTKMATTAKTSPTFAIADDITLAAGRYVKASDKRIGTAYLEIAESGDLTYVNRRSESRAVTLTEFASLYRRGMNTPAGEAATAAKVTRAPRV